jgi:hypothetical protein
VPEPVPLPIEFRPAIGLRTVAVLAGLVGAVAALANVWTLLSGGGVLRAVAAVVTAAPAILAAGLLRRRIVVDKEELHVSGLVKTMRIPWSEVIAIEQTRRSFVIITEEGDVSAGWIDPSGRDLLFRKVLELGKLALDPEKPRWGIVARFVRREPPVVISTSELLKTRPPQQERDFDSDH